VDPDCEWIFGFSSSIAHQQFDAFVNLFQSFYHKDHADGGRDEIIYPEAIYMEKHPSGIHWFGASHISIDGNFILPRQHLSQFENCRRPAYDWIGTAWRIGCGYFDYLDQHILCDTTFFEFKDRRFILNFILFMNNDCY